MHVTKTYGIYLAYPPTTDLRGQGLGRHLAAFLKGAKESRNAQFVIVSPSWSKKSILSLMEDEAVPLDAFEIITPERELVFLKIYYSIRHFLGRKKPQRKKIAWYEKIIDGGGFLGRKLLKVRSFLLALLFLPIILVGGLLALPMFLVARDKSILIRSLHYVNKAKSRLNQLKQRLISSLKKIKNNEFFLEFYNRIEKNEIDLMLSIIKGMTSVKAWYVPAAFWPSFNQIGTPGLICVPDVVLTEFPIGFSNIGGARFLDTFRKIEETIRGGSHFVTYSEHIKRSILVEKYNRAGERIGVIPHAPNTLDSVLCEDGLLDSEEVAHRCQKLLLNALKKSSNASYTEGFQNSSVKFLFYASQFRPSKNVLTLLRAYHYLLRTQFIPHKLILTGKPGVMQEIDEYIAEHRLEKDVLMLSGLSVTELAACYHLADIVVNPSLSEGACPFTFTEALSVGTPVIMANIPVTREVLTDPSLQNMTLFDPYDWHDLAMRVEWALANKGALLEKQLETYHFLIKRTWRDVVNEYIDILDCIADESSGEVNKKIDMASGMTYNNKDVMSL